MLTVLCRQSGICKIKINFWILQEKYTHTQFLLILIFRSFCVIYIKKSMSKVNCASLLTLSSTFIIIEYPLLYAVLRNSFWVMIVDHLNYLPTRHYGITFQLRALQIEIWQKYPFIWGSVLLSTTTFKTAFIWPPFP